MSDASKAARAAMKAKANRITGAAVGKVDASSWTPPEPLNTTAKTGLRPVSRRAYKKGGKVMGVPCPVRADRPARKSGGATEIANAKVNRNVKDANAEAFGKPHIGGLKTGGRAKRAQGGEMSAKDFRKDWNHDYDADAREDAAALKKPTNAQFAAAKPPLIPAAASRLDDAIASSNRSGRKIGGKGAAQIHALLEALGVPRNTYRDKEVENTTAKTGGRAKRAQGGEAPPKYSKDAVDDAIASSNRSGRKIGGKEAAQIHALLKGRTGRADGGEIDLPRNTYRDKEVENTTAKSTPAVSKIAKAKGGSVPMKDFLNGIKDKMKKRTTAPGLQKRGTFPTSMSKDDDKAFDANRADIMEASYNDYKAKKGKPSTPTVDLSEPDYKRTARKAGGRAKGKTNINIIISTGKGGAEAAPGGSGPVRPPMPPVMPTPTAMPPPPPMAGGAPPMPHPMAAPPPGLVGRKAGGRVGHRSYKSYNDMDAGGLSGLGRLEKTAIAKSK